MCKGAHLFVKKKKTPTLGLAAIYVPPTDCGSIQKLDLGCVKSVINKINLLSDHGQCAVPRLRAETGSISVYSACGHAV